MRRLTPVLGFAAGAAVFVLVTLGVAAILEPYIEISLLVGIPVGIGVGMATVTVVYVGLADDPSSRFYDGAFGLGAFGVTFLATFAVGLLTGTVLSQALLIALVAGVLAALGVVFGSAL